MCSWDCGPGWPHPLGLQVTLVQDALTVPHLGLEQVLLGDREEQALGVQRPDDVVPHGAAVSVIATQASRHVLLDHLREARHMELGGVQPPRDRRGLPLWKRWKRIRLQCRRPGFDPWTGKIPWSRKWQPTPVFLPRESNGQRSLAWQASMGSQVSDTTKRLSTQNTMSGLFC